jgi:ribose 5-phosphate isomerase B
MAKLYIASDHAGFELKKELLALSLEAWEWVDLGTDSADSVDYPYFAVKLCQELRHEEQLLRGDARLVKNRSPRGVLICGSGVGVSIAANRNRGIRAVMGWSEEVARLSRLHNAANVICFGSRLQSSATVQSVLSVFLAGNFEGGRHEKRVSMLDRVSVDAV